MIKTLFLNPANLLSIFRIFLSFPLFITMNNINDGSSLSDIYNFFFVFILIGLTDVLDGFVARKFGFTSNIGKALDPIADKICVFAALMNLCVRFPEYFLILFILIFLRDLGISFATIYFAKKKNLHFQSNKTGKLFIFFIGMTVVLFVIDVPAFNANSFYLSEVKLFSYYATWLFFGLSTYYYCRRYIREYLREY